MKRKHVIYGADATIITDKGMEKLCVSILTMYGFDVHKCNVVDIIAVPKQDYTKALRLLQRLDLAP